MSFGHPRKGVTPLDVDVAARDLTRGLSLYGSQQNGSRAGWT